MNPEERQLLERSLKLSEDNHRILVRLQRAYQWNIFWGFIKIALIVVPLVLGYVYLQPYLNSLGANFGTFQQVIDAYTSR